MKQPNGYVLYEGPSVLDDAPIVAILTLHSSNRKTGDMAQSWIMRQDLDPRLAAAQGKDESVCGDCGHRHFLGGSCYVNIWQAPGRVYQSYLNGGYPVATRRHIKRLAGRAIRLGAYGDPAAVPVEVWQPLVRVAGMTTGYTHQLGHPRFDPRLLSMCMISVDSAFAAQVMQAQGRRTFRVKTPEQPLLQGEAYCPASVEKDVQCIDCGMCSGAEHEGKSIAINVHGQRAHKFTRQKIDVREVS